MSSKDALTPYISSIQKCERWIEQLMELLDTNDAAQAARVLRAVFHTLRDRLPARESANFAAQLPHLLRGVYYEGIKPDAVPQKMNCRQFLDRVNERSQPSDDDPQALTQAVFAVVQNHVSEGEVDDVRAILPDDLASLWPQPLETQR